MSSPAPLFSVVVPAYQAAEHLPHTIRAVLSQTCGDFELIVVDDGSTDATADIARAAEREDGRVRALVLSQNGGLAEARNAGMDAARGRYLWFADADDDFPEDVLSTLAQAIEATAPQIVVFGHLERYYDESGKLDFTNPVKPADLVATDSETVRGAVLELERETVLGYAWNKVFERAWVTSQGIRFEDVPLIEDVLFSIQAFEDAERVTVISRPLYFYAKRKAANLTNKFVPDYYVLHRRRIAELYAQQRRWGRDTQATRALLGSLYARYVLSALERNCDPRAGFDHARRKLFCEEVFQEDLFRDLIDDAQARDSRALKLCMKPLKARSASRSLALARLIHFAKTGAAGVFDRTKTGR